MVRDRYGSPDVLRVEEVETPQRTEEQVLVRIPATSVNAYDWHMLRGKPYIARLSEGLRAPKTRVLGLDVAGIAEEVGAKVVGVKPGDRVFGSRSGAFAEYVAGKNMVPMPAGLSFEEAAAIPTAGVTALQAIRDHAGVRGGQRVLVNGAGGGVGSLAVQIARAFGAEVTAVTSGDKLEALSAIGADEVIDYTAEDFTRRPERYDAIIDVGGNRSLARMRRALTPTGTLVLVAPAGGQWVGPIARMVGARLTSRFAPRKAIGFLAQPIRDDVLALKELVETGKLTPIIDRTYPFEQIPDAIRQVESGNARGKVVITV